MQGLQLRMAVSAAQDELQVFLDSAAVPEPGAGEVVIKVEAAPIHPTDMWTMFGPGGAERATFSEDQHGARLSISLLVQGRAGLLARFAHNTVAGAEGAGVVVATGADAQHLLGRRVAGWFGGMYAQYRKVAAADCLVLDPQVTAEQGAACFVNPLTALGMVETMRREGHEALVHTAAASALGRMLNRLCLSDGVPLVNIVRRGEQVELLRAEGATDVLDSSAPGFAKALEGRLSATRATLAFDAVGGGRLAHQILSAMQRADQSAAAGGRPLNLHKQVYTYGALNPGPMEIYRGYSASWGVGGWIVQRFLSLIGPAEAQKLKGRVVREVGTTFETHYSNRVGFAQMLSEDAVSRFARSATGEKCLVVFDQ